MLYYTGIQLAEISMHISEQELSKHRDNPVENSQECLMNNSDVSLSGAELASSHMTYIFKGCFVESSL